MVFGPTPCPACHLGWMDLAANGTLVRCDRCGKIMSVIAAVSAAKQKEKSLHNVGDPYAPPPTTATALQGYRELFDTLDVMPPLEHEDCEAIGDRIKVKILKLPEQIEGAPLVRPESAIGVAFQGLVLSTGRGIISNGIHFPLEVQVGDIVHFQKYGGHELEVSGKSVMMLRENEVQLRTPMAKWVARLGGAKAASKAASSVA